MNALSGYVSSGVGGALKGRGFEFFQELLSTMNQSHAGIITAMGNIFINEKHLSSRYMGDSNIYVK